MTDDNDRFITPTPNADDSSPGIGSPAETAVCSPVNETDNPDWNDFPATPEWEKAFAQYAKEQAPDLMPRILARITAESTVDAARTTTGTSEDTGTAAQTLRVPDGGEPGQQAEKAKSRSSGGHGLLQFLKTNRNRIIVSMSGVAAAVIIIGLLIVMNDRLSKGRNSSGRDSKTSDSQPTQSMVYDPEEESSTPGTHPGKQSGGKGEQQTEIDLVPEKPTPTSEPDEKNSSPVDNRPDDNTPSGEPSEDDPAGDHVDDIVPSEEEFLGLLPQGLKDRAVFYRKSGTFSLSDITLGESIALKDGSVAYRLFSEGTDTGFVILWPEAEAGKTYGSITFSYAGTISNDDQAYRLLKIIDWAE